MRAYLFTTQEAALHVFQCRWEAGAEAKSYVAHDSARVNLVRAIWAGRGNHGQKVLEFVITGPADGAQAKAALVRQLEQIIKVTSKPS